MSCISILISHLQICISLSYDETKNSIELKFEFRFSPDRARFQIGIGSSIFIAFVFHQLFQSSFYPVLLFLELAVFIVPPSEVSRYHLEYFFIFVKTQSVYNLSKSSKTFKFSNSSSSLFTITIIIWWSCVQLPIFHHCFVTLGDSIRCFFPVFFFNLNLSQFYDKDFIIWKYIEGQWMDLAT